VAIQQISLSGSCAITEVYTRNPCQHG